MTDVPAFGIYEELHHLRLEEILRRHPELRSVFGKLDQYPALDRRASTCTTAERPV